MKDLEERKNKELSDKLREFEATTEILNNKIHDMEKAGMKKEIGDLKTELDEAKQDKLLTESQMENFKKEIAELNKRLDQIRLRKPWWKKLFGKSQ